MFGKEKEFSNPTFKVIHYFTLFCTIALIIPSGFNDIYLYIIFILLGLNLLVRTSEQYKNKNVKSIGFYLTALGSLFILLYGVIKLFL